MEEAHRAVARPEGAAPRAKGAARAYASCPDLLRIRQVFLSLSGIGKRFGAIAALENVSLDIAEGELVCFLGPSGCGKTTLLRVIAGLEQPDGGELRLAGADLAAVPARARNFGIVFQSYSLFPNMTVARNVGYGLECRRWTRADAAGRIAELLALVGLQAHADKYPHQLSGGQQQRIALARALAPRPAVLLLDEPLSALDAKVREELRAEIKELQSTLRITTVMVTHDQQEAMELADRIVVMNAGAVEQIGRPEDLYVRPATRFVAEFIGRMNVLPAAALGQHTRSPEGWIGVRPEAIELSLGVPASAGTLVATIRKCVYLGNCTRLVLAVDGRDLLVELRGQRTDLLPGRSIGVHIPGDAVHRFPDALQ